MGDILKGRIPNKLVPLKHKVDGRWVDLGLGTISPIRDDAGNVQLRIFTRLDEPQYKISPYKELFTDKEIERLETDGHLGSIKKMKDFTSGRECECYVSVHEATNRLTTLPVDALTLPTRIYGKEIGDDIKALAKLIYERDGDKYLTVPSAERCAAFVAFGLPYNIARMQRDLERYRIHFDQWFLESSLHSSGYVAETVQLLTDAGLTYEKDGALWLRNTDLGADKDEVLRRSNGFYTYYAVDIAYHRNKFIERGFDRVIDVWGADHHGHAIRFAATMRAPALGLEGRKLDFLIMQMVRLMRGDEIVKVSKRTGKALSLADLMDEIGVDACRFFFNAKPDTHLEFDLDLAVRQDSENPVYYVQYAHARICTLLAAMAESGCTVPAAADVDAALLSTPQERELIKQLAMLPEEIHLAARDYDPSRINRYVTELAARFHRFYNVCRIKDAEPLVRDARLKLADATRCVLEIGLGIIGVTAPEKMPSTTGRGMAKILCRIAVTRGRAACSYRPENGNNVPPESGDTLLSREQK